MIEIQVDGKNIQVDESERLIDVCDREGIDIPRFCYHKDLSIATNCRMCLIKIDGQNKPAPACSTQVFAGMKVDTKSDYVKSKQQAVMEFLLINHPLDCPICDQGGECELQDVAVNYGSNKTFFHEGKRVVVDKDIGNFIQTEMTRCIHCTRCVRFGTEIGGLTEMGAVGRGEDTKIQTFVASSIDSEISGNMIDICPVGALTSKPFRYETRSWQMQNHLGIARHDLLGSNLNIQTYKNQVKRISARENEEVNGSWISDIDRFSYLSLNNNRALIPKIKVEGEYKETTWDVALNFAVNGLKNNVITNNKGDKLVTLADKTSTLEELYLLKQLNKKLGGNNIDTNLIKGENYSYLSSNITTKKIKDFEEIIILGGSIRYDEPIINSFIRKASLAKSKITIYSSYTKNINYEASFNTIKEHNFIDVLTKLEKNPNALIILSDEINKINNLSYLNNLIREKFSHILNLSISGNINSANLLNFDAGSIYKGNCYLLFNINKNNLNSELITSINNANFVISFDSFKGNENFANVILPIAGIYENSGSFINIDNKMQSFNAVVMPQNDAKSGWKVIKVLADLLELDGFDFVDVNQVKESAIKEKPNHTFNESGDNTHSLNKNYIKQIDSFVGNTDILQQRIFKG